MTPQRSPLLLAQLVLGDTERVRAAARDVGSALAWRELIGLAVMWRVLPQLRVQLAGASVALEPEISRALQSASIGAAAHSTAIAHRAATALDRLERAGIPALAFKGIGLMAQLYDGPGQRMVSDVDILIAAADLIPTCRALTTDGFAQVTDRLDAYLEYLARRPLEGALAGNAFLVLKDRDGVEIDVHWQLGAQPVAAMDPARLLARAERARLFGREIRVADPADAILLTVHHAVRSHLVPDSTLKDLADLRAWWTRAAARWDPDEVLSRARDWQLDVPLLGLWQTIAMFDALQPLQNAVSAYGARAGVRFPLLAKEGVRGRSRTEQFRAAVLLQLTEPRLNGDLLRLFSGTVVARFIARRFRHRHDTAYFTAQMDAALGIEPPPPLRRRIAAVAHDLTRLGPRRLAAYRTLLRAQKK